jgi:hypothetical protein
MERWGKEIVCYSVNMAKNGFTRDQMLDFFLKTKNAGISSDVYKSGGPAGLCQPGL